MLRYKPAMNRKKKHVPVYSEIKSQDFNDSNNISTLVRIIRIL